MFPFLLKSRESGGGSGVGTVDSADLHDIFYITDPSGSVDGELRKLTPAGTDSQIVSSLATLVDSTRAASNGPFCMHGYLARQGKIVFSDEDGHGWKVDVDGTNLEKIPFDTNAFNTGIANASRGAVYMGSIYVAFTGNRFHVVDHLSGGHAEIDADNPVGYGDNVKYQYDPTSRRIFSLSDVPQIVICDEDAQTLTVWEDGATDPMYCVVNDAMNSDASTGGIWMIADKTPGAGNEDLKYYSIDNHTDGAADELATLDLLGSGSPIGGVNDVIDMMYDDENGVVYILIDEDGAGTSKIYAFYHGESVLPADITLIGAVSADAMGEAHMTFVRDTYAETSLTISDIAPDLWLDAADAEDAGGATPDEAEVVAAWPDKSGNNNDVQTIFGSPVYDASVANLNNKPAVNFDGSDDSLRIPDGTAQYPCTVMAVIEQQSGQASTAWALWTGDRAQMENTFAIRIRSDDEVGFWSLNGPTGELTGENVTNSVGNIMSVMDFGLDPNQDPKYLIQTTDPDSITVYQAAGFPMPATAAMDSPQLIGAWPDTALPSLALFWKAKLAEYVVVNRRLYIAEWEAIRDEWATKYNL